MGEAGPVGLLCSARANPNQVDSNGDGFGNRCDGDLNNNGTTNSQDYILFRDLLGSPPGPGAIP